MSGQRQPSPRAMRGTIRSRLLLNALVDPDEAARRLPLGLRPHVTGQGTVVGCCLLDLVGIRPAPLPGLVGTNLRAAAHRISVEWDDDAGEITTAVYVPLRLTTSRAAISLGGRVFPGVHRRASITLVDDGQRVAWCVDAGEEPGAYSVHVVASWRDVAHSTPCEPVAGTCLSAEVGLSPRPGGSLEAARMTPRHRVAHPVEVEHLASEFLAGFASAEPAPSYLMRDVEVTWTRAPRPLRIEASA